MFITLATAGTGFVGVDETINAICILLLNKLYSEKYDKFCGRAHEKVKMWVEKLLARF